MKRREDLIELVPWKGRALEVGVNEGYNLGAWVTLRPDVAVWGVDSWEGRFAGAEARARAKVPTATLVKASSVQAARGFDYPTFDLIYIDAHHEYDSVMSDLKAWWDRLKVGGIFAGHDYEMKPPMDGWEAIEVKKAVDDWAKSQNLTINVIDESCPSWWVRKTE